MPMHFYRHEVRYPINAISADNGTDVPVYGEVSLKISLGFS